MPISDLLQTQTFRDWFNKTNELVDALNSNVLAAGVVANGVFTVNGSLEVVNTFFANSSTVSLRGNTTVTANVVVSTSCNVWNFACATLLIQPLNGSTINSAMSFTAAAPVTFNGLMSANANVSITGDVSQSGNTLFNGTFTSNNGPTLVRQVLYASANAIVAPTTLSSPQYDNFAPTGLNEAALVNLTANVDTVITGIAAPTNFTAGARILYVQNLSTGFNVTFASANTSSSGNNQFKFSNDISLVLVPDSAVALVWTSANKQWRVLEAPSAVLVSPTISGTFTASGNTIIGGWLNVAHQLVISGNAAITGNLTQTGNASFAGFVNVASTLQCGNTTIGGWLNVSSTLQVAGVAALGANVAISGLLTQTGNATFAGFANVVGTLQVTGTASFAANVSLGLVANATYPIVSKTSTYTVTANDDVVLANGTFTVTLFTAVGNGGRRIVVKNTNTGVITVKGNAAELIDGVNTFPLVTQYQSVTVESDGAAWWVI